jgi:uncharacterized protein (TIGR02001 family)
MKKLVLSLLAAVMLVMPLAGAGAAKAADGWAADFDFTFNSKYVWRGMLLVDDWVIQPSANLSKGGFTFNVWGNFEPTDETGHEKQFTEVDLTAEYAFGLGDFTIPVGVIHYMFPNTGFDATTELYAGVAYDWIISPSLTIYHDVDQVAGGSYVLLAAGYSYAFPEMAQGVAVGLDVGAGVAYASEEYLEGYYGVDEAGWSDWSASLALPVSVMEGRLTFTPAVTYTALIKDELQDTTEDDTNAYFGLSVTLSF